MEKIIVQMIIIIGIFFLVGSTKVYGVDLTNEQLQTSLQTILSKSIKITQGDSNMGIGPFDDAKVDSTSIKGESEVNTEENGYNINYKMTYNIDYELADKVATYTISYNTQMDSKSLTNEEKEFYEDFIAWSLNNSLPIECYLATAQASNVNLSLAYTFLAQNFYKTEDDGAITLIPEIKEKIDTNVFQMSTISKNNNSGKLILNINLDELEKLNSSQIDTSKMYTVILGSEDTTQSSTGKNLSTNVTQNETKEDTSTKDNTISNLKTVPKSGIQLEMKNILQIMIILATIGILAILISNKRK